MAVHVSTDDGIRGSQGTASLRSTISAEEVWWCGMPYPTPEKLNWCTSPETLAPLDTEMRFWHHNARNEPPYGSFQPVNARPHTARATVDFLANQNIRKIPGRLNHQIWTQQNICGMIWIDACPIVNQYSKLCNNSSRIAACPWARNGENSARPYSSIDRVYAETGQCCVTG
jgi:hypothetical protein